MSKCCNETLLKAIGIEKMTKKTKLTFNVLYSFPDCQAIRTGNVVSYSNTTLTEGSYDHLDRPEDALECARNRCVNTGTLTAEPTSSSVAASVVFKAPFDMTPLAAGLMTFYTKSSGTITIDISSRSDFTDADTYTVNAGTLPSLSDGFKVAMVNLAEEPTSIIGEGWKPSQAGAFVRFTAATGETLTVSSIFFFESVEDLELNHVIEMSCLTGWDGEDSIEAEESACFPGTYDDTSVDGGLERTITGTAITPNYWMLNPLNAKNVPIDTFMSCNTEMTIVENGDYGEVTLIDKFEDECGFLAVQLVDPCSVTDSTLIRVDVPANATLKPTHFAVYTNADGTTTLRFNKELVGKDVRISYPREMSADVVDIAKKNIDNAPRVRLTREITYTDGDVVVFQYDNVLITSFSDSVTNEGKAEISIGISIQTDEEGRFGRMLRVRPSRIEGASIATS